MKKSKRNAWPHFAEVAFIALWQKSLEDTKGPRKKSIIHQEIAAEMCRRGYEISPANIKMKMDNLTAKYRKIKATLEASPGIPTDWDLYEKMHHIHTTLCNRHVNVSTEGSSQAGSLYNDEQSRNSLPDSVLFSTEPNDIEIKDEQVNDTHSTAEDVESQMSIVQPIAIHHSTVPSVNTSRTQSPTSYRNKTAKKSFTRWSTENKWAALKARRAVELLEKEHKLRLKLLQDKHDMDRKEFEKRMKAISDKQEMERKEFELRFMQLSQKQKMEQKESELRLIQMTQKHELEMQLLQLKNNLTTDNSNGFYEGDEFS